MSGHSEQYAEIYREMAELIGETAVLKLWRKYAGLNIIFPQRLYSKEYTRQFVKEHQGSMKPGDIARAIGLTDRRVRQIIRELRDEAAAPGEDA